MVTVCSEEFEIIIAYVGIATTEASTTARSSRLRNVLVATRSKLRIASAIECMMAVTGPGFFKYFRNLVYTGSYGHKLIGTSGGIQL